eukprot:4641498-Prorocentrum_lima.AAC.1
MTSSLVGSEMCIRDSVSEDYDSTCEADQDTFVESSSSLDNQIDRRCDGCLLYTSDAADDM